VVLCAAAACLPLRSATPQCSDGIDNDLDGIADFPSDPGCLNAEDADEFDVAPPPEGPVRAGGLLWYPRRSPGPALLSNAGFEEIPSGASAPLRWQDNGFEIDGQVARGGANSFRLREAPLLRYHQRATNTLFLKQGAYSISGWVKTKDLAAKQGSGVRLCLSSVWPWKQGRGCTDLIKGTNDWQYLEKSGIVITEDANIEFVLEAYGEPDGTAWFDDLDLHEELPLPLDAFLLYPNYRGILFDDQSQTLRFDIRFHLAPDEIAGASLRVKLVDEGSGATVVQQSFPAGNLIAKIDASALVNGASYLARLQLLRGDDVLYEHPAYRIVKLAASLRSSMSMSFDEYNRYLIRGKPAFLLGVYDAGLNYVLPEATWRDKIFGEARRLFELPINMYLNYWYGQTPPANLKSMMNVLQKEGIEFLLTGNCYQNGFNPDAFPIHRNDAYVKDVASHPGLAGFYVMDECVAELAPAVFEKTRRLQRLVPGGITFGVSTRPEELFFWRDTIDALATDPYPLHGPEPQEGYNLGQVANWTAQARQAVKGSRPISTVLQFFRFTADGPWPGREQLRNMSYMAIAEGANGLFYWSLGQRALAWTCASSAEWCEERRQRFEDLKAVMNELKSLEPALTSLDRPELLRANSNAEAIRTRVKMVDDVAYFIASNVTGKAATASFSWERPLQGVSVYQQGRTVERSATSFTDHFAPHEARVYVISFAADRLNRSRN
jgi:hypothetical protein